MVLSAASISLVESHVVPGIANMTREKALGKASRTWHSKRVAASCHLMAIMGLRLRAVRVRRTKRVALQAVEGDGAASASLTLWPPDPRRRPSQKIVFGQLNASDLPRPEG